MKAVRTWPAALVFAPAFAWLLVHLPRVVEFADPQVAWFARLGLSDLPAIVFFVLGDLPVAVGLSLIALAGVVMSLRGHPAALGEPSPPSPSVWIVIASAAGGAGVVLVVATLSNTFVDRYLIPFMPGLALGFAIAVVRLRRIWTPVPLAVVLVFALTAVMWAAEGPSRKSVLKVYNFQAASQLLMARDVRELVFLWDNPVARITDRNQLAAVGGFFFRRESRPVTVEPVSVLAGTDPNTAVLAAASDRRKAAILWLYDLDVRGTAAGSHPPRIEQLDPVWQCRQLGRGRIGVVACHRGQTPP